MGKGLRISLLVACLAAAATLAFCADEMVIDSSFEKPGDLDSWSGRTSAKDAAAGVPAEKLEVVTGFSHSGSGALKISNRSTTWQGPKRLLTDLPVAGATYGISAWIGYDEGPAEAAFVFSVELSFKDPGVAHQYRNIQTVKARRGQWVQLQAAYTVGSENPSQIDIYFELPYKAAGAGPDDRISFYLDDVKAVKQDAASAPNIQEDIPSLTEVLGGYFTIGAAGSVDQFDRSSPYYRLVARHFGAIVAGNEMKMDALEPSEGVFDFSKADRIAAFAAKTGKILRGHTLLWHQQTPAWLFVDPKDPTLPATKEILSSRLERHIKTIVDHYQHDVAAWDVVNEVLNEDGSLRGDSGGSKWLSIMGSDYIDKAFIWAREAAPDAELVINDYNLESSAAKRQGMAALVSGMKKRGIPIDAVGMQMHINVERPSIAEIKETIDLFLSLGVKVQITELDMSIYTSSSQGPKEATSALLKAQAERYKELFDLLKSYGAKKEVDMVMLWGLDDGSSWLNDFPVKGRADAPLLFDRKLQAKSAYWAIVDPTKVGL
jgi:Beta-1,4-xylanase